MTLEQFIATWTANDLTERAGAQPFIEDLCELLKIPKPRKSDDFCYEKGARKDSGGQGWADVWKRDHFAWENKKPKSDLKKALAQLREYAGNLGNPPLLIVCDREIIEIHTAFTGYPDEPRTLRLQEIGDDKNLQILRWVFTDPEKLKPIKSNAAITAEAAGQFSALATAMRKRGIKPQVVAHFLTQCIFCMFAEDEGLLHASPTEDSHIFTNLLKATRRDPKKAVDRINSLFSAMQEKGGQYGNDDIHWFNGGLFNVINIPELTTSDLTVLFNAANELDWRAIDPTIFGTLFERGLDPTNRAQLGAHYTDVATIQKLIDPLITRPLNAKWQAVKAEMADYLAKEKAVKTATTKKQHRKAAQDLYHGYLEQLRNFRVLDAACGSGNFLYLSLHTLKDLEHIAQLDAEALGFEKQLLITVGTDNVLGIETNEYAAELARITVWIGDIQWCQRNGRQFDKNPILHDLSGIQHKDALLNANGTEAKWAKADVIVGNPPFLGGSKKRSELGDAYFEKLANAYPKSRVPAGADLVCYWFDKARLQIEKGKAKAAGLVATNSICDGANRTVLDNICKTLSIFEAWTDEDWFDTNTMVWVSLVCFGKNELNTVQLNGKPVDLIHSNLTVGDGKQGTSLTSAKPLKENAGVSFQGSQKIGAFDISGELARLWLKQPNPNNLPNSLVLKPSWNGIDVTRRPRDGWIIDFGTSLSEKEAALFETPFDYLVEHVKARRAANHRKTYQKYWWRHGEPRIAMRTTLENLPRYIATPAMTKYCIFILVNKHILPDKQLIVIARSDDTTFGILHSRFHKLWALRLGSSMGNAPRYTPTTSFLTFPFPSGLTPTDTAPKLNDSADSDNKILATFDKAMPALVTDSDAQVHALAIAEAAFTLNQLRENWLNPPEWVQWMITPEEETAGFPKRPKAKAGQEANLKKRTLTNLYNARPSWLNDAQLALDKAVAGAYGWTDYTPEMTDTDILQRLLKLNVERGL